MSEFKEGYIRDFISNQLVKSSPEEIEAVQPFSKILVEDYGYPKNLIQTRPQWRVKVRPSDTKKEYPIDIGVFDNSDHSDTSLKIIVECKRKNRKDGLKQLKDYLRFSTAEVGVWFNGSERLYLRKFEKSGVVDFYEIPNMPRYGQRVDDIGLFERKDLIPATNLKATFKTIRNYLAANAVGITRDEVFAQQIINLIFCKIYDERFTKPDETVSFRAGVKEKQFKVKERIHKLFDQVKSQYDDVIDEEDTILLDEKSLTYVVGEMQIFSLQESTRDAVGDAFEVFIGPSLKGGQGQFFTPRNVVQMIIEMVDPSQNSKIIDPACGSGGFLVETLRYVWAKVEKKGEDLGWPRHEIEAEKQKVAIKNFRGIDKDYFLSKVAKAYMAILGDGRGGVFCENTLDFSNWSSKTTNDVQDGTFDIAITNPPFGKKLSIDSSDILSKFDLGYKWKFIQESDVFEKENILDKQVPQILFIEKCINLLKPGGTLGIVLLESIFGMPKYRYVVDFIERSCDIQAVVTMPEDLFQPNTHAKCCVLLCKKKGKNIAINPSLFMCEVKWCGHDSRGNPTIRINKNGEEELLDDIPNVAQLFRDGPK